MEVQLFEAALEDSKRSQRGRQFSEQLNANSMLTMKGPWRSAPACLCLLLGAFFFWNSCGWEVGGWRGSGGWGRS